VLEVKPKKKNIYPKVDSPFVRLVSHPFAFFRRKDGKPRLSILRHKKSDRDRASLPKISSSSRIIESPAEIGVGSQTEEEKYLP
jgi:hypothetical protein